MKNNEFKIVGLCKKLILYFEELLVNYPKKEYVLKDNIISTSFELLKLTYKANIVESNDRLAYQKEMLVSLSMLDFNLEISYQKKLISLKKMQVVASMLTEIRKMTFGWIKNGSTV